MDYNINRLNEAFNIIFERYPDVKISSTKDYMYFVLLWMYYNSCYTQFPHNQKGKDRLDKNASTNKRNFSFSEDAFLQNIIKDFYNIQGGPKVRGKDGRRNGVEDMKKRTVTKIDRRRKDLKNILRMIYQLRCNLMHGDKLRDPYPEDIPLLDWAYSALKQLMEKSQPQQQRCNP